MTKPPDYPWCRCMSSRQDGWSHKVLFWAHSCGKPSKASFTRIIQELSTLEQKERFCADLLYGENQTLDVQQRDYVGVLVKLTLEEEFKV